MIGARRAVGDGKYLLEYDRIDSTQNAARTLYKCGEDAIIGVRADFQESGRGRHGAVWSAPPGTCLLVTYIVPMDDLSLAPELGMTAALTVAESIAGVCEVDSRLKWPNDVLLGRRKVAGILVDAVARSSSEAAALVGIGVNLNVRSFPPELEQIATSVRKECRCETPIMVFEDTIRSAFFHRARELAAHGFSSILRRWKERDATPGRRYRARTASGDVEGVALAVADSGAIVLKLDDGRSLETINARSI